MPGSLRKLSNKKKRVFLKLLESNYVVADICEKMGVSGTWPYVIAKADPEFALAFDETRKVAEEAQADKLERMLDNKALGETKELPAFFRLKKIREGYKDGVSIGVNVLAPRSVSIELATPADAITEDAGANET